MTTPTDEARALTHDLSQQAYTCRACGTHHLMAYGLCPPRVEEEIARLRAALDAAQKDQATLFDYLDSLYRESLSEADAIAEPGCWALRHRQVRTWMRIHRAALATTREESERVGRERDDYRAALVAHGVGVGPDGDYCVYCDWPLNRRWPDDAPTDCAAPFHRPTCVLA